MKYEYEPKGTCSKRILLDIDDDTKVINSVEFVGGCPGNTIGVSTLVRGQKVEDVIPKLEGIPCGMKRTSCPDQLAQALKLALTSCALLFMLVLTSCQESKQERLEREARELTEKNCPQRITPELCDMLKKYHPFFINTQFNHPGELTEDAVKACEKIVNAGIPMGNQMVFLKGINNDKYIVQLLNAALGWIASLPGASIDGLHPSAVQASLVYLLIFCVYLLIERIRPIMGWRASK